MLDEIKNQFEKMCFGCSHRNATIDEFATKELDDDSVGISGDSIIVSGSAHSMIIL